MKRRKPAVRQPLPEHLPRETIELEPEITCDCCQPRLTRIGEDVTEVLETIPAQLKVIRYVRPKLACRACQAVFQAPSPDLPISKGRPGPGPIAQVIMSKYGDGLPLYRQSGIFARQGFEIDRQVLADWMGHAAWWLSVLAELIGGHVMAAPALHSDDTPVQVLAPSLGRTRTGRLWTYVVDEQPWAGTQAPAAFYRYSPDRKGERPRDHLAGCGRHEPPQRPPDHSFVSKITWNKDRLQSLYGRRSQSPRPSIRFFNSLIPAHLPYRMVVPFSHGFSRRGGKPTIGVVAVSERFGLKNGSRSSRGPQRARM